MRPLVQIATLPALGLLLALACRGASAQSATQQIYKWTDSAGNVHYSGSPPANRKIRYQTREVSRHTSATPAAKPAQHPQCDAARANLAALADASRPAMMDSNGDGKPDRELSPAERKEQTDLAQKFMAANKCSTGTP